MKQIPNHPLIKYEYVRGGSRSIPIRLIMILSLKIYWSDGYDTKDKSNNKRSGGVSVLDIWFDKYNIDIENILHII